MTPNLASVKNLTKFCQRMLFWGFVLNTSIPGNEPDDDAYKHKQITQTKV